MLRHLILAATLIVSTAYAGPSNTDIRPGKYILTDDSGTLVIRKGEGKKFTFAIDTVGVNCHVCGVTGVISGTKGRADAWIDGDSMPRCEISFSAKGTSIEVEALTVETCRDHCGARAGFDGTYRLPPPACTAAARQKQRDTSLRLHKARRYSQAAEALQGLITNCANFMGWIEIDQVRNDLALAQYRNGEFEQCLSTLGDTYMANVKDEEELTSGRSSVFLPPSDFDNYIAVARATWFNKSLCSKAKSAPPKYKPTERENP